MTQNVISSTTQTFTEIYDITNNLVIQNDGTASVILNVSAMNFGLLAEEEQDGVIYGYASLLNSLNYPIQIIIQSQTKDVTSYLKLLKEQEIKAKTEKQKMHIAEYRQFIAQLIHERNVLDKKFYIAIPATGLELGVIEPSSFIPGKKTNVANFEITTIVEKAITILEPKRDHIIALFGKIGLSCRQLKTQDIIKIFYNNYNPEATEGQLITDSKSYTSPIVKARISKRIEPKTIDVQKYQQQPTPQTQSINNQQLPINNNQNTQNQQVEQPNTHLQSATPKPQQLNDKTQFSETDNEKAITQPKPQSQQINKEVVTKQMPQNEELAQKLKPLPEVFGEDK